MVRLWDTAGQEDYDRLRPLSYSGADIILICFSTVSPTSLKMVRQKWYPEVKHYAPDVPILLVGTKVDLRPEEEAKVNDASSKDKTYVTTEEGEALRREIGAVEYIEISSKTDSISMRFFNPPLGRFDSRENLDEQSKFGKAEDSSSVANHSTTSHPRKKSARHQKGCTLF